MSLDIDYLKEIFNKDMLYILESNKLNWFVLNDYDYIIECIKNNNVEELEKIIKTDVCRLDNYDAMDLYCDLTYTEVDNGKSSIHFNHELAKKLYTILGIMKFLCEKPKKAEELRHLVLGDTKEGKEYGVLTITTDIEGEAKKVKRHIVTRKEYELSLKYDKPYKGYEISGFDYGRDDEFYMPSKKVSLSYESDREKVRYVDMHRLLNESDFRKIKYFFKKHKGKDNEIGFIKLSDGYVICTKIELIKAGLDPEKMEWESFEIESLKKTYIDKDSIKETKKHNKKK